MNELLELLAEIARLGLIDQDRVDDLTTRLGEVEPVADDEVDWTGTSDDDDVRTREVAGLVAYGNADPALLAETREALREAANHDDATRDVILGIAEQHERIQFVEAVGEEIAASEQAEIDAARALLNGSADADAGDGDDDGSDDGDDGGDDPGDGDEPADGGDAGAQADRQPELVASGGQAIVRPRAGQIGQRVRSRGQNPAAGREGDLAGDRSVYRLLTPVGERGMGEMLTPGEFAEAFSERLGDLGGNTSGDGQFLRFGRVSVEYPEDRRLGMDPVANGRMIQETLANAREEARGQRNALEAIRVLTASGGICAPPVPLYDYAQVGDDGRPVRAFLTTFDANRGGITWRTAPTLASIGAVDTTDSGITIWTAANDIDPGSDGPATKLVLTVDCPDVVSASIYGVATRMRHGQLMAMYDPETIENRIHLQNVATASIAEARLLSFINAASRQVAVPEVVTGFARDFLNAIDRLATAERDRQRMADTDIIEMLAPHWVRTAIRQDLVLELPGSPSDRLNTANEMIDSWFTARGLRVGWFRDSQNFGAQAGSGADLVAFPDSVKVYMFDQGHHVLLDGGRLDIGVERSPALNDTNDVQTMSEFFETVASRGIFSYAMTVPLCISGATAGTVDTSCGS